MIKLQCIGCKQTRSISLKDAQGVVDVLLCEDCGMPEIIIQAKSRRQNVDLRKVLR